MPDDFQKNLKKARILREWSQSDLAKQIGIPPSSISHFENGTRSPSIKNLIKLADALDTTTDYLLGRSNSPELTHTSPTSKEIEKLNGYHREILKDFIKVLINKENELNQVGNYHA